LGVFSVRDLMNALQRAKNANIADALLSQRYISGLGTYLISEILYSAKISPKRIIKTLSLVEYNHLYSAIKSTTHESLKAQTFTIKNLSTDIKNVNKYKFKIYDKRVDSHGNSVLIFKVKNRSIKWVPKVQK
jgi:formamidopyrimidine-DNA glycosylase